MKALLFLALFATGCNRCPEGLVGASARGNLEEMEACLEQGDGIDEPSRYGFQRENKGATPLLAAVEHGSIEAVERLIERGADVDLGFGGSPGGSTPLSRAAALGRTEIVEILLDAEANVSTRDDSGISPLYGAVSGGHFETAALLVSHGARPEFRDYSLLLEREEDGDVEAVDFLLENGLDVHATDSAGGSTLLSHARTRGRRDVVALLETRGARR